MSESLWVPSAVLLGASFLGWVVGEPRGGGPLTRFMGRLALFLAHHLHRPGRLGFITGALLVGIEVAVVVAAYFTLRRPLPASMPLAALLFDGIMLSFCFAFRHLVDPVGPVLDALGRPSPAVVLERTAGSLADGVVGSALAFTAGAASGLALGLGAPSATVVGTVAALVFRAVDTLDAKIGHRNARYLQFGRVAARLGDVASFVPARVAVFCLVLVCFLPFGTGADARAGLRARRRLASSLPSPNAGQTQSFVLGALGLRSGDGSDPVGGTRPVTTADVHAASRLVTRAGFLATLLSAAALTVPFVLSLFF